MRVSKDTQGSSASPELPLDIGGGLRSLEVMEAIYREGSAQFFSFSRQVI